ncbi:MAG: hypothetical protein ACWA41_04310 [Putridiphycobacter sp.]
MKLILKIIFVLGIATSTSAQSGYLGSTINVGGSVDYNMHLLTIFGKRRIYDEVDYSSNIAKFRKHYQSWQLNINANKVINDKIQLGLNYGYQKFGVAGYTFVTEPTLFSYQSEYKALTPITITNSTFSFNFRKYFQGIAPLGKFWGIDLIGGFAKSDNIEEIEFAYGYSYFTENLLDSKFKIDSSGTQSINLQGNVNAFILKFTYGQTIPVTEKLGIDISLRIPILRLYFAESSPLFSTSQRYSEYFYIYENSFDNNKEGINNLIINSYKKAQGFSLNFGIKYFL